MTKSINVKSIKKNIQLTMPFNSCGFRLIITGIITIFLPTNKTNNLNLIKEYFTFLQNSTIINHYKSLSIA